MKKKLLFLPVAGLLCYFILSGSASGPGLTGDGDRTGATGTTGCFGSGCHSTTPAAKIAVNVDLYDATGTTLVSPVKYVPGTSYTIKITGGNAGTSTLPKFGFQLATVLTGSTSTSAGTLAAITNTHLGTYSGIKIVEHSVALPVTTGSGGTGSTYVVSIPWTAPATGTGSVTAFAVLNAVNASSSADPGDLWSNNSLVIPEATSSTVSPITGTLTVCKMAVTSLSDATAGGTWSSSNTGIATVNTSGIVGGIATGTATITYNAGTAGNATATVTVITTPIPAAIAGASLVCVGTHIYLSDATVGGVWSSTATTMATVGTTGMVVGKAVGTATITYTFTDACGSAAVTHSVAIHAFGGTCVSGLAATVPSGTELKVFPNPEAHIAVFNLVGATVSEFVTTTNKSVDMKLNAPAGIYFITARTIDGIYTSRILVQ